MNGYEKEINSREEQKNRIRERYKGVDRSELEFIPAKPKEKLFEDAGTKRVCAYCRVSTDDANQTSSYELQKNHYEDMIKEHQGWKLVGIYADEGISGTSLQHRDEFNRMIEDCKSGKIDLIVTKSVSRFARNIVDCIAKVRELANMVPRVGVFFETEHIYTLDNTSEMMLAVLSAVAQEESHTKSEIMNISIEQRFSRGIFLTPKLLGYDKDEDGKGNEDIANGSKMITGVAWFDENANGQRDDSEKTLSNIKVHLLNTKTNNLVKDTKGNVLEATTNDNGVYVLNNIGSGKYIVVFEYNKTQYALTKYKAENVDESRNSDVMTNELSIENEKQQVASTDIIEINNENVSDINIGLIELKNFNFRLDKYISKILIQNSAGTTVKEYTDATVAKAELDGKKINGTTDIIEYEIKVTNIGEVDGYVRKIVDYMPSDLKFSSELNKDWYQTGTDLYNTSLANEKITAGQSKSVKLTLTKAMTENNTGLINNTAEIAESYNELGIADSKSTPGNRVNGESDYGSADAILSLKTGGEVYIAITIIAIIALGIPTFIIIRKKYIKGDRK